ncbi:hypothetical protein PMAYCL1PPCAC_05387, partial [Pristionchus mayeri]
MFYGNFIEKDKKEIELRGVDREDFHVLLKVLYNPSYEMKEDMKQLASLLVIADRFDCKGCIDFMDELIAQNCDKFSLAEILLFVDGHDAFRFIKLHTRAFFFFKRDDDIFASEAYKQLSPESKSACDTFIEMIPDEDDVLEPFWSRSSACSEMRVAENLPESKDLVVSGCFPTVFDLNNEDEGILSSTFLGHDHYEVHPVDIG